MRTGPAIDWVTSLTQKGPSVLRREHLRPRRTPAYAPVVHCVLLDCSASMVRDGGLAMAKGLLLQMLRRFRRDRAEVALICFGGGQAEVRFGPAVPGGWNEQWVEPIGGGGGTPLALGLAAGERLLGGTTSKHPGTQGWLWLLSDGRTVERPPRPDHAAQTVVVDFEVARLALGGCRALANAWQAHYVVPLSAPHPGPH